MGDEDFVCIFQDFGESDKFPNRVLEMKEILPLGLFVNHPRTLCVDFMQAQSYLG